MLVPYKIAYDPRSTLNLVYTSVPLTHCAIRMRRVFGARLINFPQTWGEQRTSGALKGHPAHPVLFVFVQKIDKFWFVANGVRTIRWWRSAGSQSHPHICTFGSRTVCKQFVNHLTHSCIWGLTRVMGSPPLVRFKNILNKK